MKAPPPTPPSPARGDAVIAQRYVVSESLGEGAMGEVFVAYDSDAQRVVALKLLKPSTGDAERHLFQFKQEFRAAIGLHHPHLVEVYDYGVDGERPFFTMELVRGRALPTGAPAPHELAVEVLAPVLLALDYLHARGLIHRDLKPENVRFTEEGQAKLLDLGLLTPIGTRQPGQISGTLAYMPPEVLLGKPLSAAADLYAVGVMAYELLSGSLPFGLLPPSDMIAAHLKQTPMPLGRRVPGVPPAIADLVMRLLAKEPSERPQRASEVLMALRPFLKGALAEAVDQQAFTYLLAAPMVGRRHELERLRVALERAIAGHGGGVFVGAHPGVGKSRLMQEFRVDCQLEGAHVVAAACAYESGGAYASMRQVLHALRPLSTDPARHAGMWEALAPGAAAHVGKDELHGAIADFIAALAQDRPLVICLDDLQWADTLSLEALAHCLYEHERVPVLWLGSYRLDEIGPRHPVVHLLDEKRALGIVLDPLTEEESLVLVKTMLGTEFLPGELAAVLTRTAQGNTFFLIEMLRYMVERGHLKQEERGWHLTLPETALSVPRSIAALVTRRLEHLSPLALTLARQAAVLADEVTPRLLARIVPADEQALLDAVNELLELHVWQCTEGGYRFAHDRIREAIYEAIPVLERQGLHQHLAERLEALGAPVASLGYHFIRGHDLLAGVSHLRQAGQDAERRGAMQEAFRYWKQAAEVLEAHPEWRKNQLVLDLWLDLGIKCGFSVDSREGEAALDKAVAILESLGDAVRAARFMGVAMRAIGKLPRQLREPILKRLSRPVPFQLPARAGMPPNYLALVPLLIEANTWLTIACNTNGKIPKAIAVNRKAQQLVPDRESWAWGVVMVAYAYSRVLEGRFDESIRTAREAFRLLEHETSHQAIDISCGALVLANNQVYRGEPIDQRFSRELAQRAGAHNMTEWQGMVFYAPMVHHALTGRAREAEQAIAEAQPFSRRCGRGTVLEREIWLATARVHVLKGEFDQALTAIETGLRLDEYVSLPYFNSRFFEIRGRLHLERGDLTAAAADFREILAREQAFEVQFSVPEAHLGLSEVARRRGDMGAAESHWHAARQILDDGEFACDLKRVYMLRQRGRLAMSADLTIDAREAFESACALARDQDNPWQLALTLLELGELERRAGRPGHAEVAWQEADAAFASIDNAYGMRRVAESRARLASPVSEGLMHQADHLLETLRCFSEAVSTATSAQGVLEILLRHSMDAIGGERGAILRLEGERHEVILSRQVDPKGPAFTVSQTLLREAIGSHQALLVPDVQADELFATRESLAGQSLRTLICLPIAAGDDTLALYADRKTLLEGGFGPAHLHLLRALIHFGRVAMANVGLVEQAQARAERLAILNRVSLLVSSSLDVNHILDQLLEQVLLLTGAEAAQVLTTQDGDLALIGSRQAPGCEEPLGVSHSAIASVMASRISLCIQDIESSELLPVSQSVLALGLRSIMVVPLEVQDELMGVLYVSSRVSARTFNETDLDLLRSIAAHAAIALNNARQVRLVQDKKAMEHELSIAQRIQRGFFPDHRPDHAGLRVSGACKPAREVGGDFYDVIPLQDGRIAITIGDVSGKSVSAALYMAVVRTALRMALQHDVEPGTCLREVNARIHSDITDGSFITCFLGLYDPVSRRFDYASAGHHLGFYQGAHEVRAIEGRGLPLGLDPESFDRCLEARSLMMAPGDRVVLFTDGVIEALSPQAEEFGEERVIAALKGAAGAPVEETVEAVLTAIERHVAAATPFDDLTLVMADCVGDVILDIDNVFKDGHLTIN